MTRLAPHKRSTAAERRANREAYKALKQQVEGSETTAKRREQHRLHNRRWHARRKLLAALRGDGAEPFTQEALSAITPAELAQFRAYVRERFDRLAPEERERMKANSWMLYAWLDDQQFAALAAYQRAVG